MPGSTSRSIRSRASSLPRERCRSTARSPPPRGDQLGALAQLVDERLHPRLPAREVVGLLERASQHSHAKSLLGVPARSACCAYESRSPDPAARCGDRRRRRRWDRRGRPRPQLGQEPGQGADHARVDIDIDVGDRYHPDDDIVGGDQRARGDRRVVRRHPAARRHARQAERAGDDGRVRGSPVPVLPRVESRHAAHGARAVRAHREDQARLPRHPDHRAELRRRPARGLSRPVGRTSSGT